MAPDPSHPPRPTLEELIRFKRNERPQPEFWATFDQRLREKQLAALMTRRRTWRDSLAWAFPRLVWGAPAAVAAAWVGFVVMRTPAPLAETPYENPLAPVELADGKPDFAIPHETIGIATTVAEPADAPVVVAVNQLPQVHEEDPVQTRTVADVAIALPPAETASRNWVGESDLKRLLPQVTDEPVRRPRTVASSWSRSQPVVLAARMVDEDTSVATRVVPLDLRVSRAYATNLPAGRALPDDDRWSSGSEERALRSAMNRAGKGSSSLALRF